MPLDSDRQEQLDTLLKKVGAKSWFWLFRKSDLELAMMSAEEAVLKGVRWEGAHRLELVADVGRLAVERRLILGLRIGSSGALSVTSDCAACGRPYCPHAGALLLRLSRGEERHWIEQALGEGSAVEPVPVISPLAEVLNRVPTRRALEALPTRVIRKVLPQPVLVLRRLKVRQVQMNQQKLQMDAVDRSIGVAVPMVEYEGFPERIPADGHRLRRTYECRLPSGQRIELERDLRSEREVVTELSLMELEPLHVAVPGVEPGESVEGCLTVSMESQALFWAAFLKRGVPELKARGWEVEVAADFGYGVVEPQEESWYTDLGEDGEPGRLDWFRLDLGFQIDGVRISLVPVLTRAIQEGLTMEMLREAGDQQFLLALDAPGDPVVSLPAKRLLPLMQFLQELMSCKSGATSERGLKLDRLRAAQLTDLGGLKVAVPASLLRLRERLMTFDQLELVECPPSVKAELRPYQLEGVSWLQFLREFDLNGVLADDMGLGKTLQTITHLVIEQESGRADRPSLIVAPTSVLRNWQREMKKFAPGLSVLVLHGSQRRRLFREISSHSVVVTSFPLLVRDEAALRKHRWHVMVLDEAQNIKNPRSRAAEAVCRMEARHRLCLSGTPMENHLGELWSLFEFLMPGFLGDAATFRSAYRHPIEKRQDEDQQQLLARRVRPLLLRRTKDAVAKDLPPKTEILHTVDMEGPQADLYETIRAMMNKRVREAIAEKGLDRSRIVVLDALLKLRQVCCHPGLLKQDAARGVEVSAKTEYLMEGMLPELLAEGRQVLIFSQFTEMLGIVEAGLEAKGMGYVKLTGETRDRETPVDRFQAGEVPVFLISLKAGGAGLNLTAADTVIHYDPWWNPAVEAQASDRAHRIGQTRPVFIHKLICAGTIEERILELQKQKAALLEGLLSGRGEPSPLTQEDVASLLEPLV